MNVTFAKPYDPKAKVARKNKGTGSTPTSQLSETGIKRTAVTQPAASSGTSFSFVEETYPFNKERDQDRLPREPKGGDMREFHRMASAHYPRLNLSTGDSPLSLSDTSNRHQISTLTHPLTATTTGDTGHGHGKKLLPFGNLNLYVQLTSVVVKGDIPHILSTRDSALSLPESTPPEIECIDVQGSHYGNGEDSDKHTRGEISHRSSDILGAYECLETEKDDHPATPCLTGPTYSSASTMEPGVTGDDTTDSYLSQEDHAPTLNIEVMPLESLEWGVEKIIGEETIHGIRHYLVKWLESWVVADNSQGMSELVQAWEKGMMGPEDEERSNVSQDGAITSTSIDYDLEEVPAIRILTIDDEDCTSAEWEVKKIVEEKEDAGNLYYLVDWKETLVDGRKMEGMDRLIGAWEESKTAIEEEETGRAPEKKEEDI
ncbi:hypothetical protein FCULG_00012567 [Fusarium culmorum]|uniref:Chromo domain-containing protein n=1 Tax=Fusarium culmorum TaxID=5516 RepID=A0A2T4GG68_FUSCU|nr:hypothetical protein FCULG_00012567 [Fusarium culmorum]